MIYFGIVFGLYVLAFFLPRVIAGFQEQFNTMYSLVEIGLVTAIPYALACVAMVLWARPPTGPQNVAATWLLKRPRFDAAPV